MQTVKSSKGPVWTLAHRLHMGEILEVTHKQWEGLSDSSLILTPRIGYTRQALVLMGGSSGHQILTGPCAGSLKLAANSCSFSTSMLPTGGRTAAGEHPGQPQDLAGLCQGQLRHSCGQCPVWLQHSLSKGKGRIPEGQGHHQGQGCRILGGRPSSCTALTYAKIGLQKCMGGQNNVQSVF